ncbi:MAG: 50S ribosomal protein bL37 [Acidimicrobiales bacterium]
MSKKTHKKKMKARTSKANHGRKPNAGKKGS